MLPVHSCGKRGGATAQLSKALVRHASEVGSAARAQTCEKQYKSIAELEEHLSSYDHHHKKRLKEMRQAELARTRDKRGRKEARKAAKDQERLDRQCALLVACVLQVPCLLWWL